MAIIILKKGKNAQRVNKETIEKEGYLQEHIYNNPESIPLYDIREDIRLLVLAREFHTAHGPIDALGVDEDGEVYIIETKLQRNSDRRYIVAQVLDYGASLWRSYGDFTEFMRELDAKVQEKFKKSANERVKEFFGIEDEDVVRLLENVRQNLSKGKYRFVVLLDKVDDTLKDLILFINENSRFDLFGVEFEYYKHEEYEILIPKLFGAEVRKDVATGIRQNKQDGDFFLKKVKELEDKNLSGAIADLHEFGRTQMAEPDYGTGHDLGRAYLRLEYPKAKSGFIPVMSLKSDGHFKFGFWAILNQISGEDGKRLSGLLRDKLSKLPAIKEWYTRTDKEIKEGKRGSRIGDFPGKNMAFQEAFPDKKSLEIFKSAILEFKEALGGSKN